MFSILIPTWNNLAHLKLCVDSIRRHSHYDHEVIIHVNEGRDGTLRWVQEQGLRHTYSEKNVGAPFGQSACGTGDPRLDLVSE